MLLVVVLTCESRAVFIGPDVNVGLDDSGLDHRRPIRNGRGPILDASTVQYAHRLIHSAIRDVD